MGKRRIKQHPEQQVVSTIVLAGGYMDRTFVEGVSLRPCPFCGESPTEERIEPHKHFIAKLPDYPGAWSIECHNCEFRIFDHESRENAVAKWNRRRWVR